MAGTTINGYPYPTGIDKVKDGPATIQALAQDVDDRHQEGLHSARPLTGEIGDSWYSTDLGDYYAGTGAGWRHVMSNCSVTVSHPTAVTGTGPLGLTVVDRAVGPSSCLAPDGIEYVDILQSGWYRATLVVKRQTLGTSIAVDIELDDVTIDGSECYAEGSQYVLPRTTVVFPVTVEDYVHLRVNAVLTVGSPSARVAQLTVERLGPLAA